MNINKILKISLLFLTVLFFQLQFHNLKAEDTNNLDDEELPSQAKKLLGDAIENSKIVITEYPDSKYVDDAIFIIAKIP